MQRDECQQEEFPTTVNYFGHSDHGKQSNRSRHVSPNGSHNAASNCNNSSPCTFDHSKHQADMTHTEDTSPPS
ncbi:hypothetical protein VNO78_30624 [Psophocarpus tetragonolobus]|uniref:Uncharacterized protein n=1 Tax=Psophocarpus tetragonolobus TaxID=3891 RepID=A0AAN9RX74_PSOTE